MRRGWRKRQSARWSRHPHEVPRGHGQRILLTHDLDFGDLLAATGADLPSVIIFRLRNMRPENVNRHLLTVISRYAEALGNGAIITVTEGQARIRYLPLGNGQ